MAATVPEPHTGRARAALDLVLHLPTLARLYWRLLRDPRVSILPKALLVGAIAYVVLPFDFIPDVLPFVGEVDDVVILIAASRWFVQWCPPEIVQAHVRDLDGRPASAG